MTVRPNEACPGRSSNGERNSRNMVFYGESPLPPAFAQPTNHPIWKFACQAECEIHQSDTRISRFSGDTVHGDER